MASFVSLISPKISLSGLSSMLASCGRSLPLPKPAPLRLISRSFCTISHKAGFEDSSHLDPRYSLSDDIATLIKEIDSLRSRMSPVFLKGSWGTYDGFLPITDSCPKELAKEIDDVFRWNLFVKKGCRSANNWSHDEDNVYLRLEIPGLDRAGLECRVDTVLNMDFVVYKKEVSFTGVVDGEVDPEFGDLDVGREFRFLAEFPAEIDADNSRYCVYKGVLRMVLPKSVR